MDGRVLIELFGEVLNRDFLGPYCMRTGRRLNCPHGERRVTIQRIYDGLPDIGKVYSSYNQMMSILNNFFKIFYANFS